MPTRPLRFLRRGEPLRLDGVPATRTLLALLREDLGLTGTKEGCAEGDCGACTVVLGTAEAGSLRLRAVNSCIRFAHAIDGMALWTVEDLGQDPLLRPAAAAVPGTGTEVAAPEGLHAAPAPALHPVQQALVQAHGSQCGFCTPGFVMGLFAQYHHRVRPGVAVQPLAREDVLQALSGNLCRCTGYRPIVAAAQHMATLPAVHLDEPRVLQKLQQLSENQQGLETDLTMDADYLLPRDLGTLLAARAAHPEAQLVAGGTDVGLWVTKQQRDFARVLDLSQVAELRQVHAGPEGLRIGAAVPLTEAFAALAAERPALAPFLARFAGLPVRNAGTLGGNVANGSPIGDSMPLLLALGARLVLLSTQGARTLPLDGFYTGYRRHRLRPDELIGWIELPPPEAGEFCRAHKVAKRHEDDISAVCLALWLVVDGGVVRQARIGLGGVAATPVRASRTEAVLQGQPWTLATLQAAQAVLGEEVEPLSDLRASAGYRRELLGGLLQRCWHESQGQVPADLQALAPTGFAPGETRP